MRLVGSRIVVHNKYFFMTNTRAKFLCTDVKDNGSDGKAVSFLPVTSGSEENESFFRFTPSGSIQLNVVNPEVNFEQGKEYYVDFIPAN